jgi:hypothetical protein
MNSSLQEIARNPLWWYWISLVLEEIPSRRNAATQELIDLGDAMEGKLDLSQFDHQRLKLSSQVAENQEIDQDCNRESKEEFEISMLGNSFHLI